MYFTIAFMHVAFLLEVWLISSFKLKARKYSSSDFLEY